MSDYLGDLLEKSLNGTAAIRPRLPSRFEPQGGGDYLLTPPVAPDMVEEEPAFEEIDQVVGSRPAPVRALIGSHVNASPRATSAEPQPPPLAPAGGYHELTAEPSHAPAAQPQPPTRKSARQPPAAIRGASRAKPAQASAAPQGEPTSMLPHVPAEQQHPLVVKPVVQQCTIEGKNPSKHPAPTVVLPPEPSQDHTTHPAALEPVISSPQVNSRVKPTPAAPPQLVSVSEPVPRIQVTIGRIEVRSNTSPPPPKPRSAPVRRGPALSLDAYLEQRNRGK